MADIRKFFYNVRLFRADGTVHLGKCSSCNEDSFSFTAEHPFMVLSYVTEGVGAVRREGKEWHPLRPGSLLLRFPNEPRIQRIDPGVFSEFWLALPEEFCRVLIKLGLILPDVEVMELGIVPEFFAEFERLILEVQQQSSSRMASSLGNIFSFACELLTLARSRGTPYSVELERAAVILADPAEYRLPIPELAKRLGISCSTFRRTFAAYFRMSPGEYRIRRRIERIADDLLKRDRSIKEIASEYDYPDVYVFSRQFKRFTGFSPTEYRKRF